MYDKVQRVRHVDIGGNPGSIYEKLNFFCSLLRTLVDRHIIFLPTHGMQKRLLKAREHSLPFVYSNRYHSCRFYLNDRLEIT